MCIQCGDIYHISEGETLFTLSDRQRIQLNRELNIDELVNKAINELYDDRKVSDATRKKLDKTHFIPLKKAVNEGFNQGIKVEYGTPNFEFLKQLQTNTAVFSVFKNHASMKDMAALLKDKDGNLRSREDFKREALKVDAKYRGSKLDVEYDTGVRTARMAANWHKYQVKKKLYPNLRYVQTKAAHPDLQHLSFVGIVRPIDDEFWKRHYPPNRWRCQCSVEQTDDAVTDIPSNLPVIPDDFAFNAGQTGQVFDLKNSDYIKSVPPKEQPTLIRDAEKMVKKDMAATAEYQPLYKSKTGGKVEAHPLAFDNSDFDKVTKAARSLANNKRDVIRILPDTSDVQLRKSILPATGIKPGKCPDFLINSNMVADLKRIETPTRKAIHRAVEKCYDQCDNLILSIDAKINKHLLRRHLKGKLNSGYSKLENVWIDYHGSWYKLTRTAILNGEWF